MYKASGSVRGWLPEGERFDAGEVARRLVAALRAEDALRVKVVDDVVTFDGGSAEHRPFRGVGTLDTIQDGELRVRGVAPTLAALRAGDVQYRIDWTIRTPLRFVLTTLAAVLVLLGVGLSGGFSVGLRLAIVPLSVGWISHLAQRVRFQRMLRDAVLRVEQAWRAEAAEAREALELRRGSPDGYLTPRERAILGRAVPEPDDDPPR